MKRFIYSLFILILLNSCKKEAYFNGPNYFYDSFENYSNLIDLCLPNNQLWSFTQLTKAENQIIVDTLKSHRGRKSLKFIAKKSDNNETSKSSIAKQNMAFWEGETVRMEAWYFIEGTSSLQWLFLMDIEEQTAIGAGPGMRLALVNNQLRVEYKFNEKDILQNTGKNKDFPRDQWVNIVWEIKLSKSNEGCVKVWQNDVLIIDAQNKTTLPTDFLYFQQGTKGMYSSFEIGITANSKDSDLTLWTDDVEIKKK